MRICLLTIEICGGLTMKVVTVFAGFVLSGSQFQRITNRKIPTPNTSFIPDNKWM